MLRIAQAAFGAVVVLYIIGINEENKELKIKNNMLEMTNSLQKVVIDFHNKLESKKA